MAVRVFQINDDEWWAGDCTPDEILDAYMKETGVTREEATGDDDSYPHELSEQELLAVKITHCDEEGVLKSPKTLREELDNMIARGDTFPSLIAARE